ncbi:alpha/beta-hydrolase [Fomitiporia mediterranea MF3/22]|uniref:alpha/beta-hydrolase n=1 Tax=Fomitiporia mediterranea (strain MF3/22) TaxID=694068 RepID=UPI0004408B95|nr:alpha/beta-hydrolase [Fomitiporia mediterranea MF3/22]EJD00642.1 alpha/beta-hydrolase [Fomitiporia mediterranea MF3/22]
MAPNILPFGTWDSPISAAYVAKAGISYDDVLVDPIPSRVHPDANGIYHIERRPSEAGRNVIVETTTKKDIFGKGWNSRTGVQEYGGASAIVYGGVVYFSNFGDGRVYKANFANKMHIENKNHRFANFAVHPTAPHLLVSILEDHTNCKLSDVKTSLVTIDTLSSTVHPLVSGADFYAAPAFNPDGTHLAWVQWDHPDMPWDGSQIHVADVIAEGDTLALQNVKKIKGEWKKESAVQPRWVGSSKLLFFSDESGFQNPWIVDVMESSSEPRPILPTPLDQDFAEPDWQLGAASSAVLSENEAACIALRDGRFILYILDLKSGTVREIPTPYAVMSNIRRTGPHSAVLLANRTDTPVEIVHIEWDESRETKFSTLAGGDASDPKVGKIDKTFFSAPRPLTFKGRKGSPLYVIFYPPTNPSFTGQSGERPPCIISAHGGPTSMANQAFNLKKQYFTSRGFAWVDVNYGGSSGYGREYIQRLYGNSGVIDVADCVDAARALASPEFGEIDSARVVITGSSAGGYEVLLSLCSTPPDVFAVGTSSYGISNVFTIVEDSHKFESRYGEKLLGGPADKIPHIWRARSAVFHAQKIKILQGSEDKVVPSSQAEGMMKVIRDHGGRVEYTLFEGEGHGWRKAETIIAALEQELDFYLDVLGLKTKGSA